MLVVSRKPGEKILIGDDVTVTVVRIGPNTVRLGIEAPRSMNIRREELPEDGEVRETSMVYLDVALCEECGLSNCICRCEACEQRIPDCVCGMTAR